MPKPEEARRFKTLVFRPDRTIEHERLVQSFCEWLPLLATSIEAVTARYEGFSGGVELGRDIGIIALTIYPSLGLSSPSEVPAIAVRLIGDLLESHRNSYDTIKDECRFEDELSEMFAGLKKTTSEDGDWAWSLKGQPMSVHHLQLYSRETGKEIADRWKVLLTEYCEHLVTTGAFSAQEQEERQEQVRQWLA